VIHQSTGSRHLLKVQVMRRPCKATVGLIVKRLMQREREGERERDRARERESARERERAAV